MPVVKVRVAMNANRHLATDPIGMWQSGVILPSQYHAPRRTQAPEQQLMVAVLQDAIDCVEKYRFTHDHRGRRLFDEAMQWLLAEETDWPYSFECICDVLDLDANAVRYSLRLAPEQQPESVSRAMQISTHEPQYRGVRAVPLPDALKQGARSAR